MVSDQFANRLLQGQVDGGSIATALFDMLPALPGEGPPLMPRVLAKRLFPQGFLGAQGVVPPAWPPAAAPPPPAVAQVPAVNTPAAPPAPARQPAPAGHRPVMAGDSGEVRAVRVFMAERHGM
ncbi:hypothetical protein LCGC14_1255410 [marine sediment metagenome]|uniref:Uncharacterized protein n=1 Tax=marine sediment metagenome TaxID=412755 RepID=A0A0F9LNJ5_9ZZZZ